MSERARLPAVAKQRRDEWDRYEETKRLAEMAWAALLASPAVAPRNHIVVAAWLHAKEMHEVSEKQRPVE